MEGVEPTTLRLQITRSHQLSYIGNDVYFNIGNDVYFKVPYHKGLQR